MVEKEEEVAEAVRREIRERVDRERSAYAEEQGHEHHRKKLQGRFSHVYGCANTQRENQTYDKLVQRSIKDRFVLEVGCGRGWNCRRFQQWGAGRVHGIDISPEMLEAAQEYSSDTMQFFEHDLHFPLKDQYDLIVGRAILHHVDYRQVLPMLYRENLAPGGEMIFMEPLGDNILLRLYWKFGQKYHTEDERPFFKKDIDWLKTNFDSFRLLPFNYFSLPAGLFSSLVFKDADNLMMRFCDRADTFLAEKIEGIGSRFRSGIFHFKKPTDSTGPDQAAE